ncbi:DUF5723 family protein [Tenacibaculum jejuense]|uniref:DUF5723 domain-containing protein n=1 Tax=Tenacibaculum jejuense TaxID=584609 RepID=A0A238UDK2_9FLAO|nr:DUF5723 family protein [Tenacibaculum jejuense]SNR17096.1 conserved protein of unknown function [Tenacibaculum jejuense]
MKKIFILFFLTFSGLIFAQNKQVLYGFDNIPQGLLLNPGAKTDYKYHVGVPVLSGISASVSTSGFTIADLFREDNVDFTTKFNNVINNLDNNDYAYINSQVEVINAGYKLNKRDYLSVGYYTEFDAFLKIPKEFLELIKDGNAPFINRNFLFSNLATKADVLGVIHAGITRKFNEKFTAGARLKIYSGALNVTSTGNTGSFTTRLGTTSLYQHSLTNLNVNAYSSGLYNENDEFDLTADDITGNIFLGSNLGLGFDIGFTYAIDDQTEISASLLDVGFISYSNKVRNGNVEGDYTFSGIEFLFDNSNPDYWRNLNDEINARIPRNENRESYAVMRPLKLNFGGRYSFGKSRREENCSDMTYNDYYDNALGGQIFSVLTPIGPRFALTGFYERKFSKRLNTRITYTVDDFSNSNIGLGISANIWKINVYTAVDNVLQLTDLAASNSASFQFGINFISR